MNCPRTQSQLSTVKVGNVRLKVSRQIGGLFIEPCELERFDGMDGGALEGMDASQLLKHLTPLKRPFLATSPVINCPRCEGQQMFRRYYNKLLKIEIDECRQCGGIWLDVGDPERIQRFLSEEFAHTDTCDQFSRTITDSLDYRRPAYESRDTRYNNRQFFKLFWSVFACQGLAQPSLFSRASVKASPDIIKRRKET